MNISTKKKKSFDAVEMSRRLREQTSALLSSMAPQERIDFLNRRLADFPKSIGNSQVPAYLVREDPPKP